MIRCRTVFYSIRILLVLHIEGGIIRCSLYLLKGIFAYWIKRFYPQGVNQRITRLFVPSSVTFPQSKL